jgi:hypothetical protein
MAKRIPMPLSSLPKASDDATTVRNRLVSPGFAYALAVGDIGLGFDVVRAYSTLLSFTCCSACAFSSLILATSNACEMCCVCIVCVVCRVCVCVCV